MRLIDADELKMSIKMLAKDIARANGGVDDITLALKEAYDMVCDAPAVDAVPVVHARWREPWPYHTGVICGKCETHAARKHKYCPDCGAKMDGGAAYED